MNEKLRQTEKHLADALNTQNKYERAKINYEEKINNLTELNQKFKDDMEDARNEAEKVEQIDYKSYKILYLGNSKMEI